MADDTTHAIPTALALLENAIWASAHGDSAADGTAAAAAASAMDIVDANVFIASIPATVLCFGSLHLPACSKK